MNMTTKDLFTEKEPELRASLAGVTRATWFQKCLPYVDAITFQSATSPEFIKGARFYKETLISLAEKEDPDTDKYPQPGLIERPTRNSVTSKEQSTKES
jgi:hypothetical protein